MNQSYNPKTLAPATGYSQAVEIGADSRILYIAGQLGVAPDGSFARDISGQAEQAWKNIANALEAAGMAMKDLVKVNHYLTRKEDVPAYREVRARMLGVVKPASTLLVISALARDEALVEIEAVAAKS